MTRFKAIQSRSERFVETRNDGQIRTLEVDPEIIRVEDLELADYMGTRLETGIKGNLGDLLDLNSSVCSDGT